MDPFIKAEWTHWMKELAAGRRVPRWFKNNLANIHDTMKVDETVSMADYTTVINDLLTSRLISQQKARELLGATPEDIKRAAKTIEAEAEVETGYVSMSD